MKEAMTELHHTLDLLQSQQRRINVFFRDDDVDEDEPTLRQMLKVFVEHETPVSLEIIPARLTSAGAQRLREDHRSWPGLIELDQHGWQHLNHEPTGRKCEFGVSRTYAQQWNDIRAGKTILEDAFAEAFFPAFTPPWNRCTADTLRALEKCGFGVLSRSDRERPAQGFRFQEISITLDLYQWKTGAVMKAPTVVLSELCEQLKTRDTVGMMLHHKVMDATAFELLKSLVVALRSHPAIVMHTLQSLARSKGGK